VCRNVCQPKSFGIKQKFFFFLCFQVFFEIPSFVQFSRAGDVHISRALRETPQNQVETFPEQEKIIESISIDIFLLGNHLHSRKHNIYLRSVCRTFNKLEMSEMCECVCEWTQKESCDSLPSSNNDTVLKGSARHLSSTFKWQARNSQHRITFVFFNEMLSILVHVICLGVLQNGAKYHFRVR